MATFRQIFLKLKHKYTPEQKQQIINYCLAKYKGKKGTKAYENYKRLLTNYCCYLALPEQLEQLNTKFVSIDLTPFEILGIPKDNETI